MGKPLCSLSLDLDNQWSYMKTHGDAGWESHPSYLDVAIPRFLELLGRHGLKITVFVVGQDAALEKNREALQMITAAGHEIGNHSFHHEPWFHRYTRDQAADELSRAEDAIEGATGVRPCVYRGPGYSITRDVLNILADKNYKLDASTLPTFIGPAARAYYFMTAKLDKESKEERDELFGTMKEGLRPLKPYRWRLGGRSLIEVPVTTIPVVKVPFHPSYIQYLGQASRPLAKAFWFGGLAMCKATRTEPSVLLHPLDFLGKEDVPELAFFPAMSVSREKKVSLMDGLFKRLAGGFDVLPMGAYADRLAQRDLGERDVDVAEGLA